MLIKKVKASVIKKRIEFYRDFTLSLIIKIHATHPGDDCMDNNDKTNHFNWCFNETCKTYKNQGINFENNSELRGYFNEYYFYNYYNDIEKQYNAIIEFWDDIFDYQNSFKSKIDTSILIEIYKVFDTSINIKKTLALVE